MSWQVPFAALAFLTLLGTTDTAAQNLPQPPCHGLRPLPAYAEPDAPPNLQLLRGNGSNSGWLPPDCTAWTGPGFRTLLALAASFRFAGEADDLLARFGAVSKFRQIRYWSLSEQTWKDLITDASALKGPGEISRRPDFAGHEMAPPNVAFFTQRDNRSSDEVIYRLEVLEKSPTRLVVAIENQSPVRMFLLTLFSPGALQTLYIVEAQSPGIWGLFSLTRAGPGASYLSSGHDASYVSRAIAFYRHFAGIPTDGTPPVSLSASEDATPVFEAGRRSDQ